MKAEERCMTVTLVWSCSVFMCIGMPFAVLLRVAVSQVFEITSAAGRMLSPYRCRMVL